MLAVRGLEEAGRAQVLVIALFIDIGPEFARMLRDIRFAGQIFATLDQRRRKAEVEAEQRRLLRSALQQPMEHLLARPDMSRPDEAGRRFTARLGDGDSLVPFALRARPVDRDGASEPSHLRLRGRGLGLAATQSRERAMVSRTRTSSVLS